MVEPVAGVDDGDLELVVFAVDGHDELPDTPRYAFDAEIDVDDWSPVVTTDQQGVGASGRRNLDAVARGGVDSPTRQGVIEEVVTACPTDPATALAHLARRERFAPVDGLVVHDSTRTVRRNEISWDVGVRTSRFARLRKATLRVRATPSGVLTVIELMPKRPRRRMTKRFVRVGIAAVEQLDLALRRLTPTS